jgi:hypothetical protein
VRPRRDRRAPRPRWPFLYDATWTRPSTRDTLTFTVSGWNQLEAHVAAKQKLEALGHKETGPHGDGWWFVRLERHPR